MRGSHEPGRTIVSCATQNRLKLCFVHEEQVSAGLFAKRMDQNLSVTEEVRAVCVHRLQEFADLLSTQLSHLRWTSQLGCRVGDSVYYHLLAEVAVVVLVVVLERQHEKSAFVVFFEDLG